MVPKICIFIIFCGIFLILNKTAAQTVECSYSTSWYAIALRKVNTTQYRCYMLNTNYDLKPTAIGGEHDSGKTENDVGILTIYNGNLMEHFSSLFCNNFPNLVVLFTKDAQINSIDENALFSCPDLVYLDMEGNRFRSLPKNLLSRHTKLKYVELSDNLLTTLPESFFFRQRELEEVDLQKNQIDFLPSDLFRPLVKLKYLYLTDNKIASINPEWSVKLQNLIEFSFTQNQIREVPGGVFRNLRNLQKLWLNKNKITTLNSESFEGLDNLINLNMDVNQITELPPYVFTPLNNIQNLSVTGNRLEVVHSDSFGTHDKIQKFWLDNNKIKALDEKIFDYKKFILFDFQNNICANFYTWTSSEIKPKLKECFNNYQPRSQSFTPVQEQAPQRLQQQQVFTSIYSSTNTASLSCGKPAAAQGNIIGGTRISRGAFPWIGAMVKPNGKFFCGCTLVSNRKAITAAHCIQPKESGTPTLPRDMLVLLGIHDLDNSVENGRASVGVRSIHMHDDWNPFTESFDADIAVLVLDSPVSFNKNIQPICLILPGSNIVTISQSIVVGFGQSENTSKVHESIAKVLSSPIQPNKKCFEESPALKKIASGRTFCAGQGRGQGVCKGDSGSGVFVSQSGTYYLRGVVSSSIIGGPYGCDVNNYAIFTDVVKYYDWINGISVDGSAAAIRR